MRYRNNEVYKVFYFIITGNVIATIQLDWLILNDGVAEQHQQHGKSISREISNPHAKNLLQINYVINLSPF